jgi:hypothetical protein
MSSACYKESGDPLIYNKANECSDCGDPLERKANSVKEKIGFLGFVLIIIVLLVFMGNTSDFFEKGSQIKNSAEKQNTDPVLGKKLINDRTSVPEMKKPKEQTFEIIETHDVELMALHNEKKHDEASIELDPFQKNNKLDHKKLEDIKKNIEIVELERKAKSIPVSRVLDNLNIYKQLLALEPDNPKYKKKVASYKAKLEANERKKEKKEQFVMIVNTGSAPVLSFPIKGSILGSIPAGKKVQVFEKQSAKDGMMAQIWYRVEIKGSYGWISKDVTTGDGEIRNSKLETRNKYK